MTTASQALAAASVYKARLAAPITTADIRDRSTFAATVLALYIFLLNSRVLDLSFIGYFHIPMMLLLLLMVITFARGDLKFAFESKITKYFVAFTGWVLLSVPFSTWRGGSMESAQWQVQALIIFLIMIQLVRTRRDWEKVASAYAYATLVASIMTFVIGISIEGRIALPAGSLGDPNTLAIFLVVGLPYWWLKAARSTGAKRAFFLLCTLPVYPAIARAGSRSGMLALLVLFGAAFLFANGGRKMLICVGMVLGLMAGIAFLPGYLKVRYLTLFSSSAEYDAQTEARLGHDIASSEGRRDLLIQSIKLTFRHPLFGVGPGIFPWIGFEERKIEHGSGGLPFQSHNTYTQISSETGLPGFFLFAGTMFLCVRSALRTYRQLKDRDPFFSVCSKYLVSSIAALAVGIFFLSVGYTYLLSIIFALCASLEIMVDRYLDQKQESAIPAPSNEARMPTLPRRSVQADLPAAPLPRRRPLRARARARPARTHFYPDQLKS